MPRLIAFYKSFFPTAFLPMIQFHREVIMSYDLETKEERKKKKSTVLVDFVSKSRWAHDYLFIFYFM